VLLIEPMVPESDAAYCVHRLLARKCVPAAHSMTPTGCPAQQRGRHITVLALHDPRVDYLLGVFQKDEADSLPGADCDLPVGAPEVGTGDYAGLVCAQALVNPTCDRLQPASAAESSHVPLAPCPPPVTWRAPRSRLKRSVPRGRVPVKRSDMKLARS
jgi:hypothetical protein